MIRKLVVGMLFLISKYLRNYLLVYMINLFHYIDADTHKNLKTAILM